MYLPIQDVRRLDLIRTPQEVLAPHALLMRPGLT
jgi:hypothetical protein